MPLFLKQSDLDFTLAQILFGANPPPGTDPFIQDGIRNVDGTNNNLLHILSFPDQYGNFVDTDGFGVTDQAFIYQTPQGGPDGIFHDGPTADLQTATALGFPTADFFVAPGTLFGDDLSAISSSIRPALHRKRSVIPATRRYSSRRSIPCSHSSASSSITASTSSARRVPARSWSRSCRAIRCSTRRQALQT